MERKSYQLTEEDAVKVWLRYWDGDFQHHIAASFGVNPGRINEVIKRRRLVGSEAIAKQVRRDH